ncbi:hypothetical protein BASA81_000859 [Batrachochytrium salamandrivorans]|nr:hypothetical protein BASA81_000859 [Batrachochytrium salamandrivorans]
MPLPALTLALGLGLYVLFVYTEPARLSRQRVCIHHVRCWLEQRLGLVNLVRESNGWDNRSGNKLMGFIWLLGMLFTCLILWFEGNPHSSNGLLAMTSLGAVSLATNRPHVWNQRLIRLLLFHQAVGFWYFQAEITPTKMRRMSVARTFIILISLESIEECFLQMALLSLILDMRIREEYGETDVWFVLLPIQMFLCAVLPLNVLGIPESLSASAIGNDFSMKSALNFLKGLRLLLCLIPLQLVAITFMGPPARYSPLVFGAMQLMVGLVLRVPMVSSKVDGWISPNTLAFYKPQPNSISLNAGLAIAIIGMLTTVHFPVLFLAFTSVSIVFILNGNGVYTRIQFHLSVMLGVAILINWEDGWLSSMLTFLCLASSFFSLVLACNKELVYANFAQENAAENFLSHAIKQKFASVGTAVEHILMHHSKFTTLLIAVLKECRMGHARCHSSTISRNLEQGMRRGEAKMYAANLAEELQKTVMFNELFVSATKYANTNIGLEMDWEIFHLVLTDLARRGLTVLAIQFDDNNVLTIKLSRKAAALNNRVLEVFVTHLNGTLNEESIEIAFQSSHPLLASSPVVVSGNSPHAVLAKLKFALVDDNLLIRRNFERLMQSQLGIPADRIMTMGETEEDCIKFLKRICQDQFDVAIFDQNLDYDHDIKGNELAKQARAMGFKGCLILHSSDAQLAKFLESGVFHGVVEKSVQACTFVDGLAVAWQGYVKQ